MQVEKTSLPEVVILIPKVFGDERGFFMESFNQQAFEEATGCKRNFVQDNHSRSRQGVLRGIHYQLEQAQGKLVRVVQGSVWDVAVDLRRDSAQFGQWVGVELSAENNRQLWVPEGFGHAFVVLSETADFLYKTTDFYHPESERCIRFDDPDLGIEWPQLPVPFALSEKDQAGSAFSAAEVYEHA
ncbi:dTDP-4-dehydrorhamnose 3,5-epimerase [Vreelandella songnenensis]|uniref:dTDP-4-dehydrorhamnose 3,5-epimerase n=1 Tax=Vreelandella songnenensis TaxID=1176243 RepID=A0A2T0V829_9GAMM|nr:dTDP-4-dehydrorhamnose 3,5-epimerase [Halomonas songnenensis]PRY66345.1 dTDP-4-dehydrorhamnose 3,5-epimerase [Halomonas songnenensis]